MPKPAWSVSGIAAALALAACDADVERWRQRQADIDPPALWRVEALDGQAVIRTVTVCADSVVHAGFAQPLPASSGRTCEALAEPVRTGPERTLVCDISGRRYAVTSSVVGDQAQAFTVAFAARPLKASGEGFTQTRRYTRTGPCPAGWRIGDHTDRYGRKHGDARRPGDG